MENMQIVINVLKIVPLLVSGGQQALDLYNRAVKALEDGVSPEEWDAIFKERDDVLQRIVDKTA